jgi:hypothetical protein
VTARRLFVCSALLLLCANGADGGRYDRTKDGQTRVWNYRPGLGYEATWSGDRDPNGYATGEGTLTWYQVERKIVTGSNIPIQGLSVVVTSYTGKMVRGKLHGLVVKVDTNGTTFHGRFVNGNKVSDWLAGPAPTRPSEEQPNEPGQTGAVVAAPAEGPAPPTVKQTPALGIDDSLRSLIGPPSLLRMSATAAASPQASGPPTASSSPAAIPRLNAAEVVELADAEANRQGYNLGEYQRPQAHYAAADDSWSVSYDQKDASGAGQPGKHFSVTVEDKTKKTSIAAAK